MPVFRLERLTRAEVAVLRAVAALAGRHGAAVLVGGTVRDAWLGRRPGAGVDLDIAVPAGALDLSRRVATRLGGAFVPLDPERGTGRVVVAGVRLDVTDFRGPSLAADLAARDFTVNALAVPLRELATHGAAPIVDPTGGLADLRVRRLRALRGVRLEAALGFRLTRGTVAAIRAVAPALPAVAAERVRDEVLAVLGLPAAARAFRRMDALGLLGVLVPEVEAMRATAQPAPHRFPVLEHSLRALAAADRVLARLAALVPFGEELRAHMDEPLGGGVTRGQVLKLGALLHDVAKPETRRLVQGRVRFFDHDVVGAERARAIGRRLRLPERALGVLERLVRHHLRPMHLGASGRLTNRARSRFYRDLREDTQDLLLLALADAAAVTGTSPWSVWRRALLIRDLLGGWQELQAIEAAPPLLRGEDVMHRLGLAPGPAVGRALARVREAQALGRLKTRDEALAYLDSLSADP